MLFYVIDPALKASKPQDAGEDVPEWIGDLNEDGVFRRRLSLADLADEKLAILKHKQQQRYVGLTMHDPQLLRNTMKQSEHNKNKDEEKRI